MQIYFLFQKGFIVISLYNLVSITPVACYENETLTHLHMQIAGLISAMMAMIVTVALGFLLEPLPTVRLTSVM